MHFTMEESSRFSFMYLLGEYRKLPSFDVDADFAFFEAVAKIGEIHPPFEEVFMSVRAPSFADLNQASILLGTVVLNRLLTSDQTPCPIPDV